MGFEKWIGYFVLIWLVFMLFTLIRVILCAARSLEEWIVTVISQKSKERQRQNYYQGVTKIKKYRKSWL